MIRWIMQEVRGTTTCGLYKSHKLTGKQWYNIEYGEFFCEECKKAMDHGEACRDIIKGLIKGVNTVNPVYEVRSPGGNVRRIKAKNSTAAKREYCRRLGIRPSDYWCGMTALTARRVKDEMSVYDELSNIADVVKTDIDDQAKVVSKIDDKIAEVIALLEKIELSEDVEAIEIDIQAVVKMLEKVRSELY